MAGNRKPARKPGNRASVIDRADYAKYTRARGQAEYESRVILIRNALPLGHPENVHKVDSVFGAIEGYLDEQESTGESEVDSKGKPVVTDPIDGERLPAGLSFINQHVMFVMLAERFGWGPVPDGLRRVGSKLEQGVLLFASDMQDARAALAWMRAHVADITPNEWSETLDTIVAYQEEPQHAQPAA